LLGRGFRAFWVLGNPYAQSVWMHFDVGVDSGFTFHSFFITNAAELGLLGLGISAALLFGAVFHCTRWLFRHPEPSGIFFFGFLVYVAIIGMAETTVFLPFDELSFLTVCAFVYALRARTPQRRRAPRRDHGLVEVSVP
jgi:exopolysaccharide production protein ExoQ